MKTRSQLGSEQTNQLFAFQRSLTPGKTTYLDPSSSEHRQIIETMLQAGGRSAEDYPKLFKSVHQNGAHIGDQELDQVHLVDAGKTKNGKATVTIWSSSAGKPLVNGGSVVAFDSDSGKLVAQGYNSSVQNGFLACPTIGADAENAGTSLSTLYVGHTTDRDGSTRFYASANDIAVGDQGIQCTVTNPQIQVSGHQEIEIAVGRMQPWVTQNADYIYYEPTNNFDNPYLITPFTGNVALSGLIDLPNLNVSDLVTNVLLTNSAGGTVTVNRATAVTTDAAMVAAFSVGSAPNILQWNFPYDQKGYATTGSIVYNPYSLAEQVTSYFYFAFNGIPLQGGSVAPPFFVCSIGTPEEPSINCTPVPNLYFWWHCVAEGTQVTLADGTTAPIEEITEAYSIQTQYGAVHVWATVKGRHTSAQGNEIYTLTTTNGKSITATENHVVFTGENVYVRIGDLVAGDQVMTDEGIALVDSNVQIDADLVFFNLQLGKTDGNDQSNNVAGFYTNGILSGDQWAMRDVTEAMRENLDYVLPKINPDLHRDYISALNHKRF